VREGHCSLEYSCGVPDRNCFLSVLSGSLPLGRIGAGQRRRSNTWNLEPHRFMDPSQNVITLSCLSVRERPRIVRIISAIPGSSAVLSGKVWKEKLSLTPNGGYLFFSNVLEDSVNVERLIPVIRNQRRQVRRTDVEKRLQ